MRRPTRGMLAAPLVVTLWIAPTMADDPDVTPPATPDATSASAVDSVDDRDLGPSPKQVKRQQLEYLVPELAQNPYRLAPGPRPFLNRLSFSPAYGRLGADDLFAFRIAYNPNSWLGYEGSLAHNPGQSVHAVINSLTAVVRHPWSGRFQPFLTGGYGMVMVMPGETVNAAPVTKNALTYGGGLELYIRSDLAIRADMQQATVFGRQKGHDGVVTYNYLQQTIGLAFYRSIKP
jgi:opacity protein-like surface antigen